MTILGSGFTGATKVAFGGVSAQFSLSGADTITLGNAVSGASISLGAGTDRLSLASGVNSLTIGNVTTGNPGTAASAAITGTSPNQTLNLLIPQGPQGPQGLQGAKGDRGDPGLSAYDLAVQNGFVGTVKEWLASFVVLASQQGTQGIQGEQGLQGITGAQGEQGLQGITGAQGETGAQGLQGIQGVTGLQGLQGTQGIQGEQGLQGVQGISGLAGTYAATIVPSSPYSDTLFVITHSLGTQDVQVVVYDTFSGAQPQEVVTDIYVVNSNSIDVVFAAAPQSGETYRVVVRG